MNTAAEHSTSTTSKADARSSQPFFSKRGEGGFFSNTTEKEAPFFNKSTIQPKLTIGQPNDQYEQEADQMAEKVMRMSLQSNPPDPPPIASTDEVIHRKCATCEAAAKTNEEDEAPLMRKADNVAGGFEASASLVSQLNASEGGGSPLPEGTKASMEKAFGADFSGVRVHTDAKATEMSRGIQARAFTHGRDIYFNSGENAPESSEGKRLLAHELTHVVQQNQTRLSTDTIQRQHLHTEILDLPYKLMLNRRGGTNYDSQNQMYTLSMWDYRHLSRVNGFYFLTTSNIHLITPPEVRQQSGGLGVLIPLSNSEFRQFQQSTNFAQTMQSLIQTHLNISVSSLTQGTGGNIDFSIPSLPASVGSVLSTQPALVSGRDQAAVEVERRRAASTSQARTRSFAADRVEELPMEELTRSDEMDPRTLFAMDDPSLARWFVDRLGRFQAQLFESSQAHQIPMQLLAVVILNELGDINWLDVLQGGASTFRGSLGIAQIQIDTARRDHLVDLPPGSAETGFSRAGLHSHGPLRGAQIEMGERLRIGQLLQIPQVAIEAAAREIELLLTRMAANHGSPWQSMHNFTAPGPMGNTIYAHIGGGSQVLQERNLAKMVSGAYNSPNVITGRDISQFPNANIHGDNASILAMKLFQFRLFRTN